jgi:hypothetical protein
MHRLHLLPASEPILVEIEKYRAQAVAQLRDVVDPRDWDTAHRVLIQFKEAMLNEGIGLAAPAGDPS